MSTGHTVNRMLCSVLLLSCVLLAACTHSPPRTPAPVVSLDMSEPEKSTPFDQDIYTIQSGDTLFAIAWYSGNDYRDLARINNIQAPYTIKVDQQIRLKQPPIARPTVPQTTRRSTSPSKSGQTSSKTEQAVIDRPSDQAYGKSEKDVSRQQVSADSAKGSAAVSGAAPQQFSKTVERWVWPAVGDLVGTFDKAESGNKGIDIRNQRGTPVVAAANGKVVYTGEALRGYGRLVIIKHTETFLSAYAHNDRILVEEQQWVKAGEKIGTMGSSGTDSVMLHFEVRYRGRSLDPQRYLPRQ